MGRFLGYFFYLAALAVMLICFCIALSLPWPARAGEPPDFSQLPPRSGINTVVLCNTAEQAVELAQLGARRTPDWAAFKKINDHYGEKSCGMGTVEYRDLYLEKTIATSMGAVQIFGLTIMGGQRLDGEWQNLPSIKQWSFRLVPGFAI